MIKYGIIHAHTWHSLKDSTLTPIRLCERAKELGAPAITLTDHGTMTGVDEFMMACKENGLKGIPGLEAYVAEEDEKRLHLILLPTDIIGYYAIANALIDANKRIKKVGNLIFPEMNAAILQEHFGLGSKGYGHVIATSACVGGVLAGLNYVNENYRMDLEKYTDVVKETGDVVHAISINQAVIIKLKAELVTVDKLAKTSVKKQEKDLAKLIGSSDYDIKKSLLDELKKSIEAAAKKAIAMRFEINAKSKKITELKKKIPNEEKQKELKKKLDKASKNLLTKEQLIQKMKSEAIRYQDIFGKGNFYIELQNHFIREEIEFMFLLDKIAQELSIPTVAANDVHMALKEDALAREVITSSRFHKYEELSKSEEELYIKTDEELLDVLAHVLGKERAFVAMENVGAIIDRCNVVFPNEKHYPIFDKTQDSNELIRELAYKGICKRYPNKEWTKEKADRLEYELNIICSMGYADYHLIVQDFIGFARKLGHMPVERYQFLSENISNMRYGDIIEYVDADQSEVGYVIGPGRGSAAGSITCFLLGITDIDPIAYGLIFERFLNPERISMPDIDTDFGNGYRETVIQYIYKKYGQNAVCRIMTQGTYAARGAIKEVAKMLGTMPNNDSVEYEELGIKLAKIIPVKPHEMIENHMSEFEEIQSKENEKTMEIIQKAMLIEGCFVQTGIHAAGVIISDNDKVSDYVPLMWDEKSNQWKCQCDMVQAEDKGLLKMDFLGLRNLNIITDCLREIKRTTGKSIDINRDVKIKKEVILAICGVGKTNAIFQMESGGFKSMLREFVPDCMEDLILLLAAYRPGPMDSISQMIAVKHKRVPLTFACPQLEPILSLTYGCIIYQEQVQEIFKSLAGYSFGQADLVRRAMSKKKESVLMAERESFIKGDPSRNICGCVANGIDEAVADKLFDDMVSFAKYAFNKSHAAAYAMITYITAWLKYYYPVQYMCEALEYSNAKKITGLIDDCSSMKIKVLPFDINKSRDTFFSEDNKIYFGISSIKGVVEIDYIMEERKANGPFKSFCDFVLRTEVDKGVAEGLIKVGAFDLFCKNRKALIEAFGAMSNMIKRKKDVDKKINECMQQIEILQEFKDCEENILRAELDKVKKVKINMPTIEKLQNSLDGYKAKRDEIEENVKQVTIPAEMFEDEAEKLESEKELLGVYITGHPLDVYETPENSVLIQDLIAGQRTATYGIIRNYKTVQTRKTKEDMAFFELEDKTGTLSAVCFAKKFKEYSPLLHEGAVVALKGQIVEETVESFGSETLEEIDGDDANGPKCEVIQKIFVDSVAAVLKKRKELILEVPSLMEWNDVIRKDISAYITKEGYKLIIHDNLFNELRVTNLLINPLLVQTKYKCFVK